MSKQTEELITHGWQLVRDAGATVGEAGSRVSTSLVRIAIGPYRLDGLAPGQWREEVA